ncbi:hypothetical protein [Antribacter gilvus]|uniref:hypothetical protein n=1 Tax=Antribacter gilvus TaxID=2304675 RepID=UPI000F769984|nr:hypothetical protein [Antribacter gilvus]
MSTTKFSRAVRTAGTLRLEVWHTSREPEPLPDRGFRQSYSYRITDTSDPSHRPVEGADLRSGVGDRPDVDAMLRSLASFLVAAGEAYRYTLRSPGTPSDNIDLFPGWVPEAASLNSDELTMLAVELEASQDPESEYAQAYEVDEPEAAWPPARWWDVVFLHGEEGYDVVDMIDERGIDAAIEYLSRWDHGDETRNTALFHGHVYDEPHAHAGDRTAESGPYVLVWNPGLGHVNLLRRFESSDEQPAWWPDRTAHLSPVTPADVAPDPPARRQMDSPGGLDGPAV